MLETALPRGIRQKKNGKYLVDVCVGGIRKTATCDALDKALRAQASLRLELTNFESYSINNTWTLAQACEYCLQTRWKNARNKNSAVTKINSVTSYFGQDIIISEISTKAVDEYSEWLQSMYKSGTVNLYLSGLSAILRTAYDREMLEKMPKIPHIKNKARRMRFLSNEEENHILDYFADNIDIADIITILIDTGMRKGELFSISKNDISLELGLITIWESKTNSSRSIPLTNRVAQILHRRLQRSGLFKITLNNFTRQWEKMRIALGYTGDPDFVPHILRHTCCSRLVQRGAELIKVSKWMGHNNIATTMIYAHLAPDALIDIRNLLER